MDVDNDLTVNTALVFVRMILETKLRAPRWEPMTSRVGVYIENSVPNHTHISLRYAFFFLHEPPQTGVKLILMVEFWS